MKIEWFVSRDGGDVALTIRKSDAKIILDAMLNDPDPGSFANSPWGDLLSSALDYACGAEPEDSGEVRS